MGLHRVTTKAGDVVRSWRDNLIKESAGFSPLIIVGTKVLSLDSLFSNMAVAVDDAGREINVRIRVD